MQLIRYVLLAAFLLSVFVMPSLAEPSFPLRLSKAAEQLTLTPEIYDGAYISIPYPGGDVPAGTGVCSDVVIRSYRKLGIDLQKEVHEDMKANFGLYPKLWGLARTDTNIDHRRVPNLQVFFKRHGEELAISSNPGDYKTGDIVTWNLRSDGGSLPHIGIVTEKRSADGQRPLIVHNIGRGSELSDMLFEYKITGHYRYAGL